MPTFEHLLVRRDTAANWAAVNPVLLSGEEAVETDTRRRKIGDGVTAWTGLTYTTALPADVTAAQAAAQAFAVQRANHTGTQPATTLTGLDTAVAGVVTPGGSATAAAIAADTSLKAAYGTYLELARNPDSIISGVITRDGNGAVTSAAVAWPDGTGGTFTADTVSTAFPGSVDAYHITYGSPATRTFTQPAVTRDATSGAVTNRPAMAVS